MRAGPDIIQLLCPLSPPGRGGGAAPGGVLQQSALPLWAGPQGRRVSISVPPTGPSATLPNQGVPQGAVSSALQTPHCSDCRKSSGQDTVQRAGRQSSEEQQGSGLLGRGGTGPLADSSAPESHSSCSSTVRLCTEPRWGQHQCLRGFQAQAQLILDTDQALLPLSEAGEG